MQSGALIPLILALLPTCVIMFLVLRNAKYKKEPAKKILQVFGISVLSVIPAIIAEYIGMLILAAFFYDSAYNETNMVLYYFLQYIFVVGLSEELCKFFTFRWIIFNDRQFDNTYDGVIYGAASALGFATLENIMYVFFSDDQVGTALMRALLSVPMHAITGIVMGYYFGITKYRRYNNVDTQSHPEIYALIFSILLHGIYDFVVTLPGIYTDDDAVYIMAIVVVILIMLGIYILMGITIHKAKVEKHNIYNRYYYEQLDGRFQDMAGGKTKPQKMLFGVPIFYYRQSGGFNPYNPYMNMPPVQPQYQGQSYGNIQYTGQYQQPYVQPQYQYSQPYFQPQYGQPTQPYQAYGQPMQQPYVQQPQQPVQQPVPVSVATPHQAVKYCSICGTKIDSDARFCPECGNPFNV